MNFKSWSFGFTLVAALLLASPARSLARDEYRALWVDVFHPGLKSPGEIDTLLATARKANYNALIVQVRKAADAYYNSGIEPMNESLNGSFDPLGYLIRRAHDTSGGKTRLEVHAWLVTYRVRLPGDTTWKNPSHVFQRHPEWLSQTNKGAKEGRGDDAGRFYMDPGVPQVVDYNLLVVRDLLSRYDLDGVHFDYVRYPESSGAGNIWGYNPVAVSRFKKIYGRTATPEPDDPEWCEFRRQQVNHMIRKVYAHVRAWRPRVKVSAATIAWAGVDKGFEKTSAYSNIMQDWQRMAQEGWLDLIIPMNYKRESVSSQAADHREWARYLGQLSLQTGRFGLNGVDGEELNSLPDIVSQMKATRSMPGIAGIATYCYAQTRKGRSKPVDTEFFESIRKNFYTSPARVPEATWLTRPTQGLVKGIITSGGKPCDGAVVRLGSRITLTDGSGFYAFARVNPGEHQLLVEWGGDRSIPKPVTVTAGKVAEAPVAM